MAVKVGNVKRRIARIIQKIFQKPIVVDHAAGERLPGAFIIAAAMPRRGGRLVVRYEDFARRP